MKPTRALDMFGLGAVSVAVIYGTVSVNVDIFALGALVLINYAIMLSVPGMVGRLGALILIPMMVLFTLIFVIQVGEWWISGIVVAGSVRAGMLMWQNARGSRQPRVGSGGVRLQ